MIPAHFVLAYCNAKVKFGIKTESGADYFNPAALALTFN